MQNLEFPNLAIIDSWFDHNKDRWVYVYCESPDYVGVCSADFPKTRRRPIQGRPKWYRFESPDWSGTIESPSKSSLRWNTEKIAPQNYIRKHKVS